MHKAGTTSLYEYLSEQSKIFRPDKKELHYFTEYIYNGHPISFDGYDTYFSNASSDQITVDISPTYLYGGSRLALALQNYREPKFLIMLRDPLARFYSFYKQSIKRGEINKSISFIDFFTQSKKECESGLLKPNYINRALREGCYSVYLRDWIELHGDNLKVVFFENFIENPELELNDIYKWLDLDIPVKRNAFQIQNQSYVPRYAYLHKIIIAVYSLNESIFRRFKLLVRFLKPLYLFLNKESNRHYASKEDMLKVQNFYGPYNKELSIMLKQYDLESPEWLDN